MYFVFGLIKLNDHLKSGDKSLNSVEPGSESLVQQVSYLRHKLDDEHASYKRKLQAYQDGQQRQAQLIQKLQAKVGKINLVVIPVACVDV